VSLEPEEPQVPKVLQVLLALRVREVLGAKRAVLDPKEPPAVEVLRDRRVLKGILEPEGPKASRGPRYLSHHALHNNATQFGRWHNRVQPGKLVAREQPAPEEIEALEVSQEPVVPEA